MMRRLLGWLVAHLDDGLHANGHHIGWVCDLNDWLITGKWLPKGERTSDMLREGPTP